LVADEHWSADITQEALLAAWVSSNESKKNIRAWLSTVVHNLTINLFRGESRRRQRERAAAAEENLASTDKIVELEEIRRHVVEAVLNLQEPYRSTIILRYYHDLPYKEVARRQNVPIETMRTRLKKGVALLRQRLDRIYGGERRKWSLCLAPFVRLDLVTSTSKSFAGLPAVLAGGLTMSSNLIFGLAAVVVLGITIAFCSILLWEDETDRPLDTAFQVVHGQDDGEEAFEPTESVESPETMIPVQPEKRAPVKVEEHHETERQFVKILEKWELAPQGMVLVPPGNVQMGMDSETAEKLAEGQLGTLGLLARSTPKHTEKVGAFYCDICEVTNIQWKTYLDRTGKQPSDLMVRLAWKGNITYPENETLFPARNMSLIEAEEFARWCGKRIPTEEEWTRSAAGDDGRLYSWGNEWDRGKHCTNNKMALLPVGSYESGKSPFGMYDMTGSVWEWTSTKFDAYPRYKDITIKFGNKKVTANPSFSTQCYVVKGGHYLVGPIPNRLDIREASMPMFNLDSLGFRCVKDEEPGHTMLYYAREDLDGTVVTEEDFDYKNLFVMETTEFSGEIPKVILGYKGFMVCPIRKTPAAVAKKRKDSPGMPFPIGFLYTTEPLEKPSLPAGSYMLACRYVERPAEEGEEEVRAALEKIGTISPAKEQIAFPADKTAVVFIDGNDSTVGSVKIVEMLAEMGTSPIQITNFPADGTSRISLSAPAQGGRFLRFGFDIKIRDFPF